MTETPATNGTAPLFVHLSDIHFDQSVVSRNGANAMARENLIDDLRDGRRNLGSPDAVLVTGDIAFSGKTHQYEEARSFLKRVTETLGIQPEQVQVVPGNHDVDRSMVVGSIKATHETLRRESPMEADNRLRDLYLEASDPLFAPLAAYRAFAVNYECDVSGEYPFWETDWKIGNHSTLRMRGLTTCIVSDGEDMRANLIVGLQQASVASAARNDVVMVLGHHPTDWWHDMDECEDVMRDYVSLALFGHKHVARLSIVDNSVRIVAGAVHPERHSDWLPRYNWVKVAVVDEDGPNPNLETRIWSRVMHSNDNRFRSDAEEGRWQPHVRHVPLPRWARAYEGGDPSNHLTPLELEGSQGAPTQLPKQEEKAVTDTGEKVPPSPGSDKTSSVEDFKNHAPVSPPPLAARAPVIAANGGPERVRTAIYAFGELAFATQMGILSDFKLLEEEDQNLPTTEIRMRAFARLRASNRLEEVLQAIDSASKTDKATRESRDRDPQNTIGGL